MKNIILFIFVFFSISCQFDADDQRVCCVTPPYGYTLSLLFSKNSDEANDVLLGDKVDDENVYFYYLKNQEKIKIPTYYYSGYLGDDDTELFFDIYSHSNYIYEPFIDKGLTTIYLQKRNNKIDTLQINISKGNLPTRYIMNQIKINGENAKEFPNCDFILNPSGGYCYWLKTP